MGAEWDADLLESALLATSELVNNAVVHGGDHASLAVHTSTDAVRVEVFDSGRARADRLLRGGTGPGDAAPVRADPEELSLSGRGLQIVAVLAERWGVIEQPAGRVVWFEIAP